MPINLERLGEYHTVCPDTETTGLKWKKDEAFGIALAARDGDKIVSAYVDLREKPRFVELLRRELPKVKRIVNHNMKFDTHMLLNLGIEVPLDRLECTSVRAALINEHEMSYSLDSLTTKHIGRGKDVGIYAELAELFGGKPTKEVQMKNIARAPERLASKYAIVDAEVALLLWEWQEKEIERQELGRIWSLERELMPVLIEIERHGIRVDEEKAHREWAAIDVKIDILQGKIDKLAGRPVNANSPKQMREFFNLREFEDTEWKIKRFMTDRGFVLMNTDAGNPSIDADALELMAAQGDPRAKLVSEMRKISKAKQFFANHILGHAIDGRVYPNYNQTKMETGKGTGPGRLSMDEPAMQQIPARDKDVAALVRPCFLPDEGQIWLSADWKQKEFRWFAHYTQDATILERYNADPDTDYHAVVSEITGIPRNPPHAGAANAKQINLGLVFGMGEGTMAYEMGLDFTTRYQLDSQGDIVKEWKIAGPRAKEVFSTYHGKIPGVRKLLDQASSIARARGYVKTAHDRHIRFPGGKFTHKAAGLVFQGTSADCMKVKIIELHRMCKERGDSHYLLSVHDESNLSVPDRGAVEPTRKILEAFRKGDRIECRVPILAEIKTGAHWWEACKKD